MREMEAQYAWQKKGKKYKAKYLSALGLLLGSNDAKEKEGTEPGTNGSGGTDPLCSMASEDGVSTTS